MAPENTAEAMPLSVEGAMGPYWMTAEIPPFGNTISWRLGSLLTAELK